MDWIPLQVVDTGRQATIVEVVGEPGHVRRLAELGLQAGCPLEVLQSGSPCIVQVGDSRLCLRCDTECQVLVRVGAQG